MFLHSSNNTTKLMNIILIFFNFINSFQHNKLLSFQQNNSPKIIKTMIKSLIWKW